MKLTSAIGSLISPRRIKFANNYNNDNNSNNYNSDETLVISLARKGCYLVGLLGYLINETGGAVVWPSSSWYRAVATQFNSFL